MNKARDIKATVSHTTVEKKLLENVQPSQDDSPDPIEVLCTTSGFSYDHKNIHRKVFHPTVVTDPAPCFSAWTPMYSGMPPINDVMKLCCELSANQQIKTAVKGSMKGSAAAGGLAFAGGMLGGPLGIAVGGAVGGLLGCWMTSGQFKPLPQIIMELAPQQQQRLYEDVMAILGNMQWTDLAQLTALVMGNSTMKQQVTAALLGYITKELQAEVHYVD